MNKGFVILAENTHKVNYIECAEVLAMSIKKTMPKANVTLISNDASMCAAFDHVIELPYGDLAPESDWKLINDWQVYEASPYEYTIKLEADMFLPKSIEYWWDVLWRRDLVTCTTIRNYKQEVSDVRLYRKFIDDNALPDTYNAITYFKKSMLANEFYHIVKNVFEHWDNYKTILKCNREEPVTTDWAYALAAHILGVEYTTMPEFKQMSFVHMKQYINGCPTEDWTDTFVYECLPEVLRIQTIPQEYPFHYHIKSFNKKLRGCV